MSVDDLQLTHIPTVRVGMLIRTPPGEVFQAFVDPAIAGATGGFTTVLCALKALLEHDVVLTAVRDHHPNGVEP